MAWAAATILATAASAQPLGTFTWQLQPFCNVVTLQVTQQGALYTAEGFDEISAAPRSGRRSSARSPPIPTGRSGSACTS